MREVLSSPPDDYLRAMARRLLALSLLLAVVTVGATDAWAHSDDGEMTVTNAEQSGPNTVQVQVGIVYANDREIADQASVTATLSGPNGATVGPVTLPLETGSLYGAAVDVPSPGPWQVDVTSTAPAASASATVTVTSAPEAAPTTPPPNEVAQAPLAPTSADPGNDDDSSPVLWIVLGAVAMLVVAGGVVYAVQRSRS